MAPAKRFHLSPRPALDEQTLATAPGRLIVAASVATRLLQVSKVRRWHDLGRDLGGVPENVMLEPAQVEALIEFDELLHLLHQPVKEDDPAPVSLHVCLGCGAWSLHSVPRGGSGGSSKKCNLTLNCPGPTTKASAAVARPAIVLAKEKKATAS